MARIGLKYAVAAKITAESPTLAPTYAAGFELGGSIEANISTESETVKLYADDQVVESVNSFSGGSIGINIAHIDLADRAALLGHTMATEGTDQVEKSNSADNAPFFGVGYIRVLLVANVRKYRAVWLYKTQFSEPEDTGATKGEKTEFSTDQISGTIFEIANGDWKDTVEFTTEAAAKTWLNTKASIV